MKIAAIYPLLIILAIFPACKKKDSPAPDVNVVLDIRYVDQQGNSVLNAAFIKDLKVFYLIDGQATAATAQTGHETGFIMHTSNGETQLRVFPYIPKDKSMAKTILRFNDQRHDTVSAFFQSAKGGVRCTKVLYDEVLKWEINNSAFPEQRQIVVEVK